MDKEGVQKETENVGFVSEAGADGIGTSTRKLKSSEC